MKYNRFSSIGALFLLLFVLGSHTGIWAQTALPKNEEVHIGTLENGLKYYIQPNQRPKEIVELRLVLDAGSILEDEDQQGLAHFTEHMLFNGTESFPKNELVHHLQSMGVEFGADLNAYTSFDETVYILPIPTTDPKNLDIGFQILQEWASKATLSDKDIDEERGIVLEESRSGKGAMDRMMRKFLPLMLNHSRYSKRLPIGKEEIIKNFDPEVLRRYYKDWYRPDLMSVIVVGDITVEEAEKKIKEYFGVLKNPKNARKREYAKIDAYDNQYTLVVTDKEAPTYSFSLMYSAKEKKKVTNKEEYREKLIENLALNMLNRRYSEKVKAEKTPYAYAYVGFDGYARNYENFSIAAAPVDDIEKTITAVLQEILRVKEYGFKNGEFDRAKKRMLNSAEQAVESKNDRRSGAITNRFVQHALHGGALFSPENTLALYQEFLPGINLNEVNQKMRNILEENKEYFGLVFGNGTDIKVPTDKELRNFINNAMKQDVEDIEETEVKEMLINKDLEGGTIVSEKYNKVLDYTTYTLSNGIKVHVKPTDLRSNEIIMSASKKGGTSKYGVEDKYNIGIGYGQMVSLDLESMGFGEFTPNDLTNYMTGKNASVSTRINPTSSNVSGQSNIKDFETLLELTYLKMTSLRNDKELLKNNMNTIKAQIGFLANMPQIGFVDSFSAFVYNNDERAPLTIPKTEDFDKVDLDRVIEIYNTEFASADGYEFVFVGNIDTETMLPLIAKYLGAIPVNHQTSEVVDNGLRTIKGKNKFEYFKGSEPQSMILVQVNKEMPYDIDKALRLSLLSDIITNRIIEEIREEHALIYGGAMQGVAQDLPYEGYTLIAQMPCGPENVDAVLQILEDEIQKMIKKGIDKKDLEKAQKAALERFRKGLEENNRWASYIMDESLWGKNATKMMNFVDRVEKIKTKDLEKLLDEMWNKGDQIIAVLNPEEGED